MRTTSILLSYLLPLLIVAAGSVGTANAGDQSYPQFVDCSPRMSGDHCDSFYFQVRAELPERDHPNNANIRYHLMSGPGEIDEHTGWWHWYTDTATFSWWHSVEIAASVGHSPMHTTPPEEYCRFMVEPQDVFSRILLDGQPHRSIFFVTAPGVHEFDIEIVDPDECDAPTVEIFRVWYPPAGSLYIENDKLIFEAAEADQGKKFQVTLHTPGGPPTPVHEFYFDTRENIPTPVFYRCSDDITMTACDEVHYAPLARFPDSVSSSGILYDLVSGPGHMVGNWHWTFEPTVADIGQTYEVEIAARYGPVVTSGDENCRFNVTVIEQPVGIHPMDFTCGEPITIPSEISSSFNMRVFAGDCSKTRVRVAEVTPSFVGTIDVVENRGSNSPNRETHRLTVLPDSLDGDQTFHLVIECISISGEYYSCEIDLVVEELQPYRIVIQTLEEVQQGEHAYVDVVLEEGNIPMGGFSFSLTHNVSALMPVGASPGPFFQQCNWADLEFHRGPIGPPQDDLPPGLFRVSGQAGHKGDTLRPTCFFPDSLPATLFTIDFLVTNDRTFECDSPPVDFFWQHCFDNRISSKTGRDIFMSREVFDSEGSLLTPETIPSYSGAPDSCLDGSRGDQTHRLIDFYGGALHIACDTTGWCQPGDLNSDGVPFQVSDAVLYTNYFVRGLSVFSDTTCIAERSDANQDGIPLSIADLQYIIQIIVGDGDPYFQWDSTSSNPAIFRQASDGVASVSTPDTLGPVWFHFGGVVTPQNLTDVVGMDYHHRSDSTTSVWLGSLSGGRIPAGPLLGNVHAPLLEVQTCTYTGAKVEAIIDQVLGIDVDDGIVPTEYALEQNYPNPFNNSTVIQFDLPQAGDVRIKIYNVLGRVVYQKTQYFGHGRKEFVWDGRSMAGGEVAAGVYFYRLESGSFTQTKKMLLLK